MAIKEKKKAEEVSNEIEIPEGKEIKDIKITCPKHGDITKSTYLFTYDITVDDHVETFQCGYCIPCINEYLMKLQEEGKIEKIVLSPVIGDIEKKKDNKTEVEDAKVVEEKKEEKDEAVKSDEKASD